MPAQAPHRDRPAWLTGIGRGAIDLLFPARCAFCGDDLDGDEADLLLCSACKAGMLNITERLCSRCAMPLPQSAKDSDDCVRCRGKRFRFAHVWPLGIYRETLREAVICMKRQYYEPLVFAVGRLLAEKLKDRISRESQDMIVPMPIHWTRRWSRQMNVSELMVESMNRELKIPTAKKLLVCCRKLKKQGTLGPQERILNVRGAFRVSTSYDIKRLRILLVDDVMTTGATANEATRALCKAGAARVDVVVAARALGAD